MIGSAVVFLALVQLRASTAQLASRCTFALPPETPYYWDEKCLDPASSFNGLGCFADSAHTQCRFCGEQPYTGIPCPPDAIVPDVTVCRFPNPPAVPVYWEPQCVLGMLGCKADGHHIGCRFCGGDGVYSSINCGPQACEFPVKPGAPYYWDSSCAMGQLGCLADGIHIQCRFCRTRPYESITCPASVGIGAASCYFVNEPKMGYYWEPSCKMGDLGCWADGIHAECRFCGGGAWESIPCPPLV